MKIDFKTLRRNSGSVLVLTLVVGTILTTTLVYYLSWTGTQNLLVSQSQAWNASLAAAEAGIEEGLAQVNVTFGTNYFPSLTRNWSGPSGGLYGPRTNSLSSGWYSVTISNDIPPTIYSTGFATAPAAFSQVSRTVKVTTRFAYAFGSSMAALNNIDMSGNKLMVDSYDSSRPGVYSDANGNYVSSKRKAGGDVASMQGTIDVQNANIYGHAYTAPWGSLNIGANGMVGDLPANWPTQNGLESGWYKNDYNANFKDVPMPDLTSALPIMPNPKGNKGFSTNTYTLTSGTWQVLGNFSINNNETVYVPPYQNAVLYVSGNFTMQGQNNSFITIGLGAQLTLYVGSTNTSTPVSTSLTKINTDITANATNFTYYGLPNNTSLSWQGNAAFKGTVYAPEAAFSLGGGGSSNYDYQGSCVINSVTMKGIFDFHYDENLRHAGPISGFIVSSWQEL